MAWWWSVKITHSKLKSVSYFARDTFKICVYFVTLKIFLPLSKLNIFQGALILYHHDTFMSSLFWTLAIRSLQLIPHYVLVQHVKNGWLDSVSLNLVYGSGPNANCWQMHNTWVIIITRLDMPWIFCEYEWMNKIYSSKWTTYI